jgi:hypothetical protein
MHQPRPSTLIFSATRSTMYTLVRTLPTRRLVMEQLPAIATAFVVAELFYKFQSFVLECGAFLATWFVLDMTISSVRAFLAK